GSAVAPTILTARCCGASSSVSDTTKPPALIADATSGFSGPAVSTTSSSTSSSSSESSSTTSSSSSTSNSASSSTSSSSSSTNSSSSRIGSSEAMVAFLPFVVATTFFAVPLAVVIFFAVEALLAVACFGVVVTQVLSLAAV